MSALLLAGVAVLGPVPAGARDHRDHDEIREAVERGDARPLTEILAAVRARLPGEVVGVRIEHKDGRWLYEFRVVDRKGRLVDVHVDARTAEIERIQEK
jgi:uncharacterized membrane protein YkoI